MYSICRKIVICSCLALPLLFVGGCGEFFDQKTTELQARSIVNNVNKIVEEPEVKNPVPAIYCEPPKILNTAKGVKLFYFTKHHSPKALSTLLSQQLGNKASTSDATNQLIVNCKDDKEAHQVIQFLEKVDVRPIQVKISCLILEHYADVTMDWETTIQIQNLLGEDINLSGKVVDIVNSKGVVLEEDKLLPAFPGASLRDPKRSSFGLDIGYFNNGDDGHIVKTAVDLLVSRGYMKVLMNPEVETINGKQAEITSRDKVPLTKIVTEKDTEPYQITEYIWVEDKLKVTPFVYSDGSIGLVTHIMMGSKSTPEGVSQLPIITERAIDVKENRLKPGQSLIIGGFKKSEKFSVIRGVPFLKDIPWIGVLFSSKDFEERAKEITFILTPSISSNGVEHCKMVDWVREKRKDPECNNTLEDFVTDPFGTQNYTKLIEKQAAEEEIKRVRAEIEAAETAREVHVAREKLRAIEDKIKAESQKTKLARGEAEKLKSQLSELTEAKKQLQQKIDAEVKTAKARYNKALKEAEQAKKATAAKDEEIRKLREEAQRLRSETDKLRSIAQQASQQAQEESQKVGELKKKLTEKEKAAQQKAQEEAKKAEDAKKQEPPKEAEPETSKESKPDQKTPEQDQQQAEASEPQK